MILTRRETTIRASRRWRDHEALHRAVVVLGSAINKHPLLVIHALRQIAAETSRYGCAKCSAYDHILMYIFPATASMYTGGETSALDYPAIAAEIRKLPPFTPSQGGCPC